MTTEALSTSDIVAALDRRYGQRRGEEKWVTIVEARTGAGFDGNRGQCDFLAINTWKSQGLQLIGHEIKVSAADWRRELAAPEKAETFARYCRRWWVVMPSQLARESKAELPPTWGLLSVSDRGNITELVKAPARKPDPPPTWWWIGWLAQVDRSHRRRQNAEIDALVEERITPRLEQERRRLEADATRTVDNLKALAARVDDFHDKTGIDIRHTWPPHWEQLGQIWHLVRSGADLAALSQQLRHTADHLDRVLDSTTATAT
jgi:hypothetical protein